MLLLQSDTLRYVMDTTTIYVGFGLVLLGFLFWLRRGMKKHPDLSAGEVVHLTILKDFVTFFMTLLFAINLGEAVFAASIHVVGETPTNPVARIVIHMAGQITAIVLTVIGPLIILRAIKIKKNRFFGLLVGLIVIVFSVLIPYMNLYYIVSAVKQIDLLHYVVLSINPWNDMCSYYEDLAEFSKYPDMGCDFSPLAHMEYPTITSCGTFVTHVAISFIESLLMAYLPLTDMAKLISKKFNIGDLDTKEDKSTADDAEIDTKDGIEFLLTAFYGKKTTVVNLRELIDKSHDIHTSMSDPDRSNLTNKISSLFQKIKLFNKQEMPGMKKDELDTRKAGFRKEISALWANKTTDGKGFGITLKSPN